MYQTVFFDISGICNARCPWCVQAERNDNILKNSKKFIDIGLFSNALERMLALELINKNTIINLFNWGEPLIHPKFPEIINELNKRDLIFGISTNASNIPDINPASMQNLNRFEISMSGFSQSSYDRIHGFKFNKIISNIDQLLKRLKRGGYKGTANLVFHIYQFNIHEICLAKEFCADRNLDLLPYTAHLNNLDKAFGYLNQTLSAEELRKISKDLLMYYVDDLVASRPKDYLCPQFDYLTLDESCQVLTCCGVAKGHPDYSIGSLFDLSAKEIEEKKRNQSICIPCKNSGTDYWGQVGHVPPFVEITTRGRAISLAKKILPKSTLRILRTYYLRMLNR